MGTLNAVEFVSLDGVMQGFHGTDDRDGFRHSGGWGTAYADDTQTRPPAPPTSPRPAPTSWDDAPTTSWCSSGPGSPTPTRWPPDLNRTPKFVATRTPRALSWRNAQRLEGELTSAVASLKAATDGTIVVLGSGALLRQLFAAGLVDGLRLFVHPLVLGSGHRLFPTLDDPWPLRLERAEPTPTGVLMLTYVTDA